MLTQNEISTLNLSATKKDFVQIWNELLEVAGKLSERWDPTSTNESDPGIVILKALTGIADKLNYNIDKNILEAFMPTAAQEDSMRKLCEMLGYNVKYYQSAQTAVTIKYYNSDPSDKEASAMANSLAIPKFTVITNSDQDISYFTINENAEYISSTTPSIELECMEGQIVKCESVNSNNVITINQISENNRFYLPEVHIAENGIFIYNVFNNELLGGSGLDDGTAWTRVDNLNIQTPKERVYKFGFDSYENRPYIEFPKDYSELFNDGIFIYYTRTSGASGNISAKTLTRLELPSGTGWSDVAATSFVVENAFAATNGSNIESITQAYNNFKKTVGTFETLVTCRDYMNKIYTMTGFQGKPLVSNVLVTDIRNDLNRALTICSCNDSGIFYKETPILLAEKTVGDSKIITNTASAPDYTNYVDVGNPEYSGWDKIEEYSDWTQSSNEEITEQVVSEANKPKYYKNQLTTRGEEETKEETKWYIDDNASIPLFADDFIQGDNRESFVSTDGGDVLSRDTSGQLYDCWYIKQGKTLFKTKLPVTTIDSIKTVIKETQTVTVKEQQTKTVYKQRNSVQTKIQTEKQEVEKTYAINHFDLVLYPFKSYSQIKTNVRDIRKIYDSSFSYATEETFADIQHRLENDYAKTIAHNIKAPTVGDIISINNYLRLNVIIFTSTKITVEEGEMLKDKIKIALANAFNMRELDFGEEIPFDSIVEVIENADPRVRVASLNEPALYTTFTVYTGKSAGTGTPIFKEFAVESNWLTLEEAKEADRFNINKFDGQSSLSTFNTKEAKELYNWLALRNVLAGRVPLFKYNDVFKGSFSESAYQITTTFKEKPKVSELPTPNENNPFTIYNDITTGNVYTGQYNNGNTRYTATYTPDDYLENLVSTIDDNAITDIDTSCEILSDTPNSGVITNVTLGDGEFVRFRAPNLVTTKTYPAYVNYHLALNKELSREASAAEGYSLFEILNADKDSWSFDGSTTIRWQKVLDYFSKKSITKTFTLTQKISAYSEAAEGSTDLCDAVNNTSGYHVRDEKTGKCIYCGKPVVSSVLNGPIIVNLGSSSTDLNLEVSKNILASSGCVKLTNDFVFNKEVDRYLCKATLNWENAIGGPSLDIFLDITNPFITSSEQLDNITAAIDARIDELRGQTINNKPALPDRAWTISFDFDYVPFEAQTLNAWKTFASSIKAADYFGFKPITEDDQVFWRKFGEGYSIGKYILETTEKLLKFDKNYFSLLPENVLTGIYLIKDLGNDAQPVTVKNGDEYELKNNEYLYIEYTPSSVTEEGTSQELPPVTEILGPGTIIKPSGFDVGLMDSSAYAALGNSYHKKVDFKSETGVSSSVDMYRFGANEQVEIRELAAVTLNKDTFRKEDGQISSTGSYIWYYKNFNNCEELEKLTISTTPGEEGKRINNVYTLKDGEYIFYTDSNKSELAYYTTGTEITLDGNFVMEQFDIIELATIFESGLQAIPWQHQSLADSSAITFQEYQYITLGYKDTLKEATLLEDTTGLSKNWQYCSNVAYMLNGATNTSTLSTISISNKSGTDRPVGCGWEACSILELSVSPDKSQVLRNNGQVQTSVTLTSTSPKGSGTSKLDINLDIGNPTLAFKTNVVCQTSSTHLDIEDIYSNPNKAAGFEFKIFAPDQPAIVETEPGKVVPHRASGVIDITNWPGTPVVKRSYSNLWTSVDLKSIKTNNIARDGNPSDYALRLPISILPNTYGVFSVYLDYLSSEDDNVPVQADTWIEIIPGTDTTDVSLLNVEDSTTRWVHPENSESNYPSKLYLRPGINCVRVNTTCKIFIKSSSEAQGSLFFDELKLVDCQSITSDSKTIFTTQGLNIAQIGYLNPEDSSGLDADTRIKLKNGYIDNALSDVINLSKETNTTLTSVLDKISQNKPKLEKMKDLVANAGVEANSVAGRGGKDIVNHIGTYFNLADQLESEEQLLKALSKHKNLDESVNILVKALESFSVTETDRQQLLEAVENLRTQALTEITNISNEDFLEDFEKANNKAKNNVVALLKATCENKIEDDFNEQITPLLNSIEKVANSEERVALLDILDILKIEFSEDTRYGLLAKVRQLTKAFDGDELFNMLNKMMDEALSVNYTQLDSTLVTLREFIKNKDISALMADIENAANENADNYLKSLVTNLQEQLTTSGGTISSIVTAIDKVISTVRNKHAAEEEDKTTVTNPITNIYTSLSNHYRDQLNSILEEIYKETNTSESGLLAQLNNSYTIAVEALQASRDARVGTILDKLTKLKQTRETYVNNLASVNQTNTKNLPFYEDTVLAVWPDYVKQELISQLNLICSAAFKCIKNSGDINAALSTIAHRLSTFIDYESFEAIFKQIEALRVKSTQALARSTLIKTIGDNLSMPNELSTLDSDNDNIAVINTLIAELQSRNTSISTKQTLIKNIKEELAKTIATDRELVITSARISCPSILTVSAELPEADSNSELFDSFYEVIAARMNELRDDLYVAYLSDVITNNGTELRKVLKNAKTPLNTIKTTLEGLLLLLNYGGITQELEEWLSEPNNKGKTQLDLFRENSYTTEDFQNTLIELKDLIILQNQLKDVKSMNFIEMEDSLDDWIGANVSNNTLKDILKDLVKVFNNLNALQTVDADSVTAYNISVAEEHLLADILAIDKNRDFYYTAPTNSSIMIDFNESSSTLNTLMNPATNYDINNINNNFVISKLDIGYLDKGIQIARSSRLN